MSTLTREQVESMVNNLVCWTRHLSQPVWQFLSAMDAHDQAQRDMMAALQQRVEGQEKTLQLVHFILEHQDGDYDNPDIIQAEAEQYGIEKLFTLKQQLAARQAELARVKGGA